MYQPPKLNVVGDAREVILGIYGIGYDADLTTFNAEMEYEADPLQTLPGN